MSLFFISFELGPEIFRQKILAGPKIFRREIQPSYTTRRTTVVRGLSRLGFTTVYAKAADSLPSSLGEEGAARLGETHVSSSVGSGRLGVQIKEVEGEVWWRRRQSLYENEKERGDGLGLRNIVRVEERAFVPLGLEFSGRGGARSENSEIFWREIQPSRTTGKTTVARDPTRLGFTTIFVKVVDSLQASLGEEGVAQPGRDGLVGKGACELEHRVRLSGCADQRVEG